MEVADFSLGFSFFPSRADIFFFAPTAFFFLFFSRRSYDGKGSQFSRQTPPGGVGGAQREPPREGRGSRAPAEEAGVVGAEDSENRHRLSGGFVASNRTRQRRWTKKNSPPPLVVKLDLWFSVVSSRVQGLVDRERRVGWGCGGGGEDGDGVVGSRVSCSPCAADSASRFIGRTGRLRSLYSKQYE